MLFQSRELRLAHLVRAETFRHPTGRWEWGEVGRSETATDGERLVCQFTGEAL